VTLQILITRTLNGNKKLAEVFCSFLDRKRQDTRLTTNQKAGGSNPAGRTRRHLLFSIIYPFDDFQSP